MVDTIVQNDKITVNRRDFNKNKAKSKLLAEEMLVAGDGFEPSIFGL